MKKAKFLMLMEKGYTVFGDEHKFIEWHTTPNKALGDKKPIDCEFQDVIDILGRIEHGIVS